jgi:tetratricopeptide (TPR) repeat protein
MASGPSGDTGEGKAPASGAGRDFYESLVSELVGQRAGLALRLEGFLELILTGKLVPADLVSKLSQPYIDKVDELVRALKEAPKAEENKGLEQAVEAMKAMGSNVHELVDALKSGNFPGHSAPKPGSKQDSKPGYGTESADALNEVAGKIGNVATNLGDLVKAINEGKLTPPAAAAPYPVHQAPVPVYQSPYPSQSPAQQVSAEPPQYFREAVSSMKSLADAVRQLLEKKETPEPEGGPGKGYQPPEGSVEGASPADSGKEEPGKAESLDDVVKKEGNEDEDSKEEPKDPKETLYKMYEAAKEMRKQGQYGSAIQLLGIVAQTGKFEERYKIYTEVGVIQLMVGNYEAAEAAFSQVLEMEGVADGYKAIAVHNLGFIKEETGDMEGASKYAAIKEGSLDTVEILYNWMLPEPKPENPQNPEPQEQAAQAA